MKVALLSAAAAVVALGLASVAHATDPGPLPGTYTERAFYNPDPRDSRVAFSPCGPGCLRYADLDNPAANFDMHLLPDANGVMDWTGSWVNQTGLKCPDGHRTPPFTLDFVIMPDLTGYMNVSAEGDCTGAGIPTTAKTQYIPA